MKRRGRTVAGGATAQIPVGNAIKFTDTGAITMTASRRTTGEDFRGIQAVGFSTNQGQGWYRAWVVDRKAYCRNAGGKLRVESALGSGSTFFTVPLKVESRVGVQQA
jgi:hypothetical protein